MIRLRLPDVVVMAAILAGLLVVWIEGGKR